MSLSQTCFLYNVPSATYYVVLHTLIVYFALSFDDLSIVAYHYLKHKALFSLYPWHTKDF